MASSAIEANDEHTAKITRDGPIFSPISLCNEDILMCIFETTVEDEVKLVVATILSKVCKKWGHVSLNTPRLWQDIVIYCWKPFNDVFSFLDRMHSHVKNIPINLFIQDFGYSTSNLVPFNLFRFPHIQYLRCIVHQDVSLHHIDYNILSSAFQGCQIDELDIQSISEVGIMYLTLSRIAKSLPSVTILFLTRILNIEFMNSWIRSKYSLWKICPTSGWWNSFNISLG